MTGMINIGDDSAAPQATKISLGRSGGVEGRPNIGSGIKHRGKDGSPHFDRRFCAWAVDDGIVEGPTRYPCRAAARRRHGSTEEVA